MAARVTAMGRMSDPVALARDWIGTPYQHQASAKHAGTDCLGIVIGVWREMGGRTPALPAYTPDWTEVSGRETLLDAAGAYLSPLRSSEARPGDVLAFRLRPDLPVKHLGILATPTTFIHAYQRRAVCESAFVPFWRRRHSHTFRFPELSR